MTLDQVEEFVRGKAGSEARRLHRQGELGAAAEPRAAATQRRCTARHRCAPYADAASAALRRLTDPDPDTTEPPASYGFRDPVAPNPSPGTTDDPQPRRQDDDPAPLTPGERPHP